ncbi:MAG: hypothetical protein P8016_01475, partial [Sedimentisphaerales bacterium]
SVCIDEFWLHKAVLNKEQRSKIEKQFDFFIKISLSNFYISDSFINTINIKRMINEDDDFVKGKNRQNKTGFHA